MTARVLIVEDHALVAIGLQLALSARGWDVETTDGPTAADVIEHAQRFQPQCVLLDINLGEGVGSGIDLVAPLRATGADVVMLTAETRRGVLAACLEAGRRRLGRQGRLPRRGRGALNDVLAGTPLIGCTAREAMIDELRIERAGLRKALTPFEQLTMRERDVLAALVDGLSAEEIAETQYVALTTVRSQIRAVLQKLGVRSQLAAVAHANRVGWKPENTASSPSPDARRATAVRVRTRAARPHSEFSATARAGDQCVVGCVRNSARHLVRCGESGSYRDLNRPAGRLFPPSDEHGFLRYGTVDCHTRSPTGRGHRALGGAHEPPAGGRRW